VTTYIIAKLLSTGISSYTNFACLSYYDANNHS